MSGDIQIASFAQPSTDAAATVLTQTGDRNIQVAHADAVHNNNTIHINLLSSGAPHRAGSYCVTSEVMLSTEYYNLFVIGAEAFDRGHFTINRSRALTECLAKETAEQFAALSEEAIARIKTFPCLFASENHWYGHTDPDHQAYFGIVIDIRVQDNGVKVYFQLLSAIPQQKLNEIVANLSIEGNSSFNELNRTHWTIKKVDLIEELSDAGIKVLPLM